MSSNVYAYLIQIITYFLHIWDVLNVISFVDQKNYLPTISCVQHSRWFIKINIKVRMSYGKRCSEHNETANILRKNKASIIALRINI